MNLFGYKIEKRNKKQEEQNYISNFSDALNFGTIYNKYSSMNLSALFRCVDLISDGCAILPINVKIENNGCKDKIENHSLYNVFESGTLSKFTLIKRMVQDLLLKGNGYCYIERNSADGSVTKLRYLPATDVQIHYDKVKDSLYYTCNVYNKKIEPCNMIHLVKYSTDGINGVSVLTYASRTLNIANSSENAANKFFEQGGNLSGILKVQGQLSDKQRQDIRSSWNVAFTNGGSGLAILQGNMDYTPVQLSNKDSQLLETRLFNVQDIARFFGVSPILLGDLSHSSYNSIEVAQTEFVLHTLQPYITLIEQEFTRKLFKPSEHNLCINLDENYLLRSDKQAQSNYYATMLKNGIFCINEIRQQLGLDKIEGGDKHIIPYTDIKMNSINQKSKHEGDKEN